jgi:hypothetical protein
MAKKRHDETVLPDLEAVRERLDELLDEVAEWERGSDGRKLAEAARRLAGEV